MLPSVNAIPKPRAVESNMFFYCGCGRAFERMYC